MLNGKSSQFLLPILVVVALLFVSAPMVRAAAATVDYEKLKVVHVWGVNEKNGELTDESNGLYNTIVVEIENLAAWAAQDGVDAGKLILYLDGDPLKVNTVKLDKVNENKLSYVLFPRDPTEHGWKDLLGRPHKLKRTVSVTVGLEGKLPVQAAPEAKIKLTIINVIWFWIYIVMMLVLLVFFVWLSQASDVLRDAGPTPATGRKTFSLGRSQMAFWFLLVVASYLFIFLVTSAYGALSTAVLALIGISAGTALSAAVIDSSKRNAAQSDRDTLMLEQAKLDGELAAPGAAPDAAKQARLDQVKAKIKELTSAIDPQPTTGFWKDILSDESGISFHRFQMAIWTLVLGVIFIAQVYNVLSMPDFPGELLALMGISGGTYIGFKFPEKQN
jgi:hypothetical protein